MDDGFETTGLDPTLGLLIDRAPGRQVVGHHSPETSRAHEPAKAIEQLAQGIVALGRFFSHECQVLNAESPLVVVNVTRITLSFICHPQRTAGMYLHCTDNS